MYKFAHTLNKFNFDQHELNLLHQHVDYYLISLINGLNQVSFGLNTIARTAMDIEEIHQKFNKPNKKWFIDSGGYSIIVGDVSPRDMNKFIDCYSHYLERFAPTMCDYILSLDIPILLKYPQYNTIKYIKKANYESGTKSREILNKNKELFDKFIFIWQFKTPNQYKIWCEYYDDIFKECDELRHFAIGGQVGLRGVTGITFSPFTALSYKILNIIYEKNIPKQSILHLLGIYGLHDRFLIGILDKLFNNYYLVEKVGEIQFTFDTVHHMITGLYNIRNLKSIIIEKNNIIYDYNQKLINKFHLLIEEESTLKEVQNSLSNILNNEKIENTRIIACLEIIKNQTINRIINQAIDHYQIVELFLSAANYNKFKNQFTSIFYQLEKDFPYIFSNRLNKILLNFQYTYAFHDWWTKGRDPDQLEQLIYKFISLINFPHDLT
jgi:hypothetical protein